MAIKTLYVGNLPFNVSEAQLTSHFSTYGASNARIVEGRGFGFVDVNADQATMAIADRNQTQMDGRTLTVNEARPREARSGSGGGGGGNRSYGTQTSQGRSSSRAW